MVKLRVTQPLAEDLLTYDELIQRLDALAQSSRVRLRSISSSHEGHPIPLLLISDTKGLEHLSEHRHTAHQLIGCMPYLPSIGNIRTTLPGLASLPKHGRLPVLFAGASFGDEASHVEALVEVAEHLAWSDTRDIKDILSKVLLLIIPLMNPDGRERAIEEWHAYPLSSGSSGEGNSFGQIINRDFLYTTQPESRAVSEVLLHWHPLLVWDVHEDTFSLGKKLPQFCLAPPTGESPPPGIPEALHEESVRFGEAIAATWASEGFDYLFRPDGRHGFSAPETGKPARMTGYNGRLVYRAGLSGILAFITESARTPGVQSWEARSSQKFTAAIAILRLVADNPNQLIAIVRKTRAASVKRGAQERCFFLIPTDQDWFLVNEAIRILRANDVEVYRAPDIPGFLVIPSDQPTLPAIEVLLAGKYATHDAISATLGVQVIPSTKLVENDRVHWLRAPLQRLDDGREVFWTRLPTQKDAGPFVRVANTLTGIRLVNRLLGESSVEARWNVDKTNKGGDFILKLNTKPSIARNHLLDRSDIVEVTSPEDFKRAMPIDAPRIGLYGGQGANLRQGLSGGAIQWALDLLGFRFSILNERDIRDGVSFKTLDLLIIPNGDAEQIANGWDADEVRYAYPWQLPGEPLGIGHEGQQAIRSFVENGGTYIGIDSGGGWFAGPQYLGLIDFEVSATGLGIASVDISVEDKSSPIFAGLSGSWGMSGEWRPAVLSALFGAEPYTTKGGGSVFQPSQTTKVLAKYISASRVNGVDNIVSPHELTNPVANAAIISSPFGEGIAIVFGIDPVFRCQWMSTCRLITNCCFLSTMPCNTMLDNQLVG